MSTQTEALFQFGAMVTLCFDSSSLKLKEKLKSSYFLRIQNLQSKETSLWNLRIVVQHQIFPGRWLA